MFTRFTRIFTGACWLLIGIISTCGTSVLAAPQEEYSAAKAGETIKVVAPKVWTDADYAGIPAASKPEILTWERAYMLALIRHRTPFKERVEAETFDPKAVDEQAKKLGVADFERFRQDFLAEGKSGERFVDPARSLLDLLGRLQRLENAKKRADSLEMLRKVFGELLKGEASGLGQSDFDRVDLSLQKARQRFLSELRDYRDKLDEVKVELGLSPASAIVPDQTRIAGFHDVFARADDWMRDPNRKLGDLPKLVDELPRLPDVVVGQVVLNAAPGLPDDERGQLDAALRAAEKQRPGGNVDGLDLRIRRRVRFLLEARHFYDVEKRAYLLALRMKDAAFESLIAPPTTANPRSAFEQTRDLLNLDAEVVAHKDGLATVWASFHAERLALARDLGTLPASDWKSFYSQIDSQLATRPTPSPTSKGTPR
jgi:hypothetical protein